MSGGATVSSIRSFPSELIPPGYIAILGCQFIVGLGSRILPGFHGSLRVFIYTPGWRETLPELPKPQRFVGPRANAPEISNSNSSFSEIESSYES